MPGSLPKRSSRTYALTGGTVLALAPHYDDAVFSCGALLHRYAREGHRVVVATIFGGPPATAQDAGSPIAKKLHERWTRAVAPAPSSDDLEVAPMLSSDDLAVAPASSEDDLGVASAIVALRRAEDAAAVAALGAVAIPLDFADCIYRRLDNGAWRCASEAALFSGIGSVEPGLEAAVAAALSDLAAAEGIDPLGSEAPRILAPLGLGNHVDHRLVRAAAERALGRGLAYYEDVPYALDPAAWAAFVPGNLVRFTLQVLGADVEAKIAAASHYMSQLSTFWPDEDAMAMELVVAAAAGVPDGSRLTRSGGFAESLWRPHRAPA